MVKLKKMSKYILQFSELPKELVKNHWLSKYQTDPNLYLEVNIHLEENEEYDELDRYIIEKYPFLKNQQSFLINFY